MAVGEIGGISVKLKAEVDTSGTVKGYAQIAQAAEKIQEEFKQTEIAAKSANASIATATNSTASAAKKATAAFKMQKGSLQQLGYQIQDVAVMSQYGADKFVILGTQGSQIASLFGPGGAVFGAVLAIAAAIGGTLVKSINAAKDASSELPKELMTRLDDIKARFEEVDEASRSAFLRVEFDKINAEYDKYQERIERARDTLVKMGPQAGVAYAKQAQAVDNLVAKQKELADMMDKISRMSVESIDFSGIDLSIDGGDAGVQSRVEAVKNGIEKERELYEAWRQTKAAITSGIITDEQAQLIQADIAEQQRINSKFDNTMARLEEERKLLAENQVLSAEEKAARQAEIDAAELAADKLHKEQLSQQAIEYASKTAKAIESIERTKSQTIQQLERATWATAAGLLDQFAGKSKAAAIASIAISKGLALAQNFQNTLVAQTRALAELGPIAGPPMAAKIGTYGKINGALIAATGLAQAAGAMSGGNSASTFSGGVPAVNTTSSGGSSSQSVNRTFDIRGLNPSDMISGQQVYDLLKALSGDGYDFNFIGG